MENKFKEGEIVYSKKDPETALVISRYTQCIYYCCLPGDLKYKILMFFENELMQKG
jgi:hypothetical protein